jgi:uncharacterized protein YcfL
MRTLTIWTLVLTMLMLSGCATSNVCPPFPKPSKEVVMELQSLDSKAVDSWVVELYKLQLKLESK